MDNGRYQRTQIFRFTGVFYDLPFLSFKSNIYCRPEFSKQLKLLNKILPIIFKKNMYYRVFLLLWLAK